MPASSHLARTLHLRAVLALWSWINLALASGSAACCLCYSARHLTSSRPSTLLRQHRLLVRPCTRVNLRPAHTRSAFFASALESSRPRTRRPAGLYARAWRAEGQHIHLRYLSSKSLGRYTPHGAVLQVSHGANSLRISSFLDVSSNSLSATIAPLARSLFSAHDRKRSIRSDSRRPTVAVHCRRYKVLTACGFTRLPRLAQLSARHSASPSSFSASPARSPPTHVVRPRHPRLVHSTSGGSRTQRAGEGQRVTSSYLSIDKLLPLWRPVRRSGFYIRAGSPSIILSDAGAVLMIFMQTIGASVDARNPSRDETVD
jgi:hypothetical protein